MWLYYDQKERLNKKQNTKTAVFLFFLLIYSQTGQRVWYIIYLLYLFWVFIFDLMWISVTHPQLSIYIPVFFSFFFLGIYFFHFGKNSNLRGIWKRIVYAVLLEKSRA